MTDSQPKLDLILTTRLDVLAQAVEEVKVVMGAMEQQRKHLDDVEGFLTADGTLAGAEERLWTKLGFALTQLEVMARQPAPQARPRRLDAESANAQAAQDGGSRLSEVRGYIEQAKQEINTIGAARSKTYSSFEDVRRWSIAGLEDTAPGDAAREYQKLIDGIRKASDPWRRYENEIPRRGYELFDRYLELVAGMAVRGFGLDENILSDVEGLIKQLMAPLHDASNPLPPKRSPLALMGSLGRRHLPLGYPEWSLWALPLVGRRVGELVATKWSQGRQIDTSVRVLCADIYAQYALGPSYLHAAVFLEFDPNMDSVPPEMPSDAVRTTLLLQTLPQLGGGRFAETLQPVADTVQTEWQRARAVFGGTEPEVDPKDRAIVEDFLQDITEDDEVVAYDVARFEEDADDGRLLAAEERPMADDGAVTDDLDSLPTLRTIDLMNAMWLARLEHPEQSRVIHRRAKKIAQAFSGGRPPGVTGGRGGSWV